MHIKRENETEKERERSVFSTVFLAETLNRLGVQPERVDQLEVAIDEYDKVPDMIDEFVARIVELGPNPFKGM